MTIEVRQLTIKSSVQRTPSCSDRGEVKTDAEDLKADVLARCRDLIVQMLRQERER